MLSTAFLRLRTDQAIALARVVLALFALAAVWLDPGQPIRAVSATYAALSAYVVVAILTAGLVSLVPPRWSGRLNLGNHLLELSVFTFLLYSTEGPTSPFFLLFTFSIVSAALSWHWKGALWTSTAALTLLLVSAAIYSIVSPDFHLEWDRLLLRASQVIVVGAVLAYYGYHQERLVSEVSRILAWEPNATSDPTVLMEAFAGHAGRVFSASASVVLSVQPDEPCALELTWKEGGKPQRERLELQAYNRLVSTPFPKHAFIAKQGSDRVATLTSEGSAATKWGPALSKDFVDRYDQGQVVLSVPVGANRDGRLFLFGNGFRPEDLYVATLLSGQVTAGLTRLEAVAAQRDAAVAEERLQLARDLHDGILQTLSGIAIHLEALSRSAKGGGTDFDASIKRLQAWLREEQRSLRELIQGLRPGRERLGTGPAVVPFDLGTLIEGLKQQWGVDLKMAAPDGLRLALTTQTQIGQMVREAVANAYRHGRASSVSIKLDHVGYELHLEIADNGTGLDRHGRFDEAESAALRIGPRSLRERVLNLRGSMSLDSRASGLTINIRLPVQPAQSTSA